MIQRCVQGENGAGGYVTFGVGHLIDFVTNLANHLVAPYPHTAAFITVTVQGPAPKQFRTADTDPEIPQVLAGANYNQARLASDPITKSLHAQDAGLWALVSADMTRGSSSTWWQGKMNTQISDEDTMTYECDAGLGSPLTVDCAQVEYSQLGAPTDTISVRPEEVTFLHSNTCFLAISASIPTVLTWAQIRAALTTLVNTCVENPVSPARGGRAYYGKQPVQISGRRRKKQRDLTGLDALPPSSNLTLWEQQESWTDSAVELKTCAWLAISKGVPVSTCHQG